MSLFMAAMAQELREKGRIDGFGGISSASWTETIREHVKTRAESPERRDPKTPQNNR